MTEQFPVTVEQYDVVTPNDGVTHERIIVTIRGAVMTGDGPHWGGQGLIFNGGYTGRAYYKQYVNEVANPSALVFHRMQISLGCTVFCGAALFENRITKLKWVKVPLE